MPTTTDRIDRWSLRAKVATFSSFCEARHIDVWHWDDESNAAPELLSESIAEMLEGLHFVDVFYDDDPRSNNEQLAMLAHALQKTPEACRLLGQRSL